VALVSDTSTMYSRLCGQASVSLTYDDNSGQATSARVDNTQGTCGMRIRVYRTPNGNIPDYDQIFPAGQIQQFDLSPGNFNIKTGAYSLGWA
jgi:hypothetical protein